MIKKLATAILFVSVAALVGCETPSPSPTETVPANWGSSLEPTHRDIPYVFGAHVGCPGFSNDESCGGSQLLDIYPVTQGGRKGTFVFVHGGGFLSGDKYPMAGMGIIKRLTNTGWDVVSVNYRLVSNPAFVFPAAIQDVNAALRWVRANGTKYRLSTQRLVVGGHSAGGTLAMLAALGGNSQRVEFGQTPPLSGWVSISGIANFQAGNFSRFWGETWIGKERFSGLWQVASPQTWIDSRDPRGYVAHGDLDQVVEYRNASDIHSTAPDMIEFETVDFWANGSPMPQSMREHLPTGGMNAINFQRWLDSTPTLHAQANPFGSLDAVTLSDAGVRVRGWVIDPDTTNPVKVHIYADNKFLKSATASNQRSDVGRLFPLYGPLRGYDTTIATSSEVTSVCVYAINVGPGNTNTNLGCRDNLS